MSELSNVKSFVEFGEIIANAFLDVIGVAFDDENCIIEFHDKLELPNSLTLNMGMNNEQFKALVSINFEETFLWEFVEKGDKEMGMDALGEVLNTLGGYLAEKADIKDKYGELIQAPPMKFETKVIFPRAEALRGVLKKGSEKLYFGFLIQPAISPFLQRILEKKRRAAEAQKE